MKIDGSPKPGSSPERAKGTDALSFFGGDTSGKEISFSAHLKMRGRHEQPDHRSEPKPRLEDVENGRAAAESAAMAYAQKLQRHEEPLKDLALDSDTQEIPAVQSSAQIRAQSVEVRASDSVLPKTVSSGDLSVNSTLPEGAEGNIPASGSTEENVAALLSTEADMALGIPDSPDLPLNGADSTLPADSAPEQIGGAVSGVIGEKLAVVSDMTMSKPVVKSADELRNESKKKGRSLEPLLGTHSAKAQRSMTDDPKSTVSKLSTLAGGEEKLRPEFRISSEADSILRDAEMPPNSGDEQIAEATPYTNAVVSPTNVHSFQVTSHNSPVQAPVATVVHSASRGFEPVFRAIGEVAEKMRLQGPRRVEMEVQLDSGEKLMVRLELHDGRVRAVFRGEAGEFQQALQQGWSNFVQQSAERGVKVTDARFEASLTNNHAASDQQSFRERAKDESSSQQAVPRRLGSVTNTEAHHRVMPTQPATATTTGVSLWA